MSTVLIDCPPKGAKVRHTTVYDSTTVVIEGRVYDTTMADRTEPYILIGDGTTQWCAYLVDRKGEYTVALEVLEPAPLPDQPECGTVVLDFDGDAWQLVGVDIDEPGSGVWRCGHVEYKWTELNALLGPLRRLIPDPAALAPELPAKFLGYEGRRDLKVMVEQRRDSGLDDRVLLYITEGPANCNHQAMTPDIAELVAGALLRAAREARQS